MGVGVGGVEVQTLSQNRTNFQISRFKNVFLNIPLTGKRITNITIIWNYKSQKTQ